MEKMNNLSTEIEQGETGNSVKCYIACAFACYFTGGFGAFVAGLGSAL